jgi:hypothetical protein
MARTGALTPDSANTTVAASSNASTFWRASARRGRCTGSAFSAVLELEGIVVSPL